MAIQIYLPLESLNFMHALISDMGIHVATARRPAFGVDKLGTYVCTSNFYHGMSPSGMSVSEGSSPRALSNGAWSGIAA